MNLEALQALVAKGENERQEFKRSTGQRTDAAKTICAMLNGIGGFVLFGVSNDGTIAGQEIGNDTIRDVSAELRRMEPPAFPDVETVMLDSGKGVIVVRISGGGGPYTYDGRPFCRRNAETELMPRERYERLLLERMHATNRWENQAAVGLGIEDLDKSEIARTVEEAVRRLRMEDPGTRDPAQLLLGLGLLQREVLLNAAVVLFGRSDRLLPTYPQCVLRLARFRGTDKTEFIDNRQEVGHAFDLLQRAQRFLRDHLPVAGRVVPGLFERVDDPVYPPVALREALANALCHRDYGVGGGAVTVAIYDDRLEIASTGALPFDLTLEDLVKPHPSRPWNPLIAHAFYRRGIIESWGRGTLKITELARQAGLAAPEFEVSGGEVRVRFHPSTYVAPTRVGRDLTSLQRQLLEVVSEARSASLRDIRGRLAGAPADRTIRENLAILRNLDLLETTGHGRGARWILRGSSRR
jgi:ATP-dependent DNA helicase RecG